MLQHTIGCLGSFAPPPPRASAPTRPLHGPCPATSFGPIFSGLAPMSRRPLLPLRSGVLAGSLSRSPIHACYCCWFRRFPGFLLFFFSSSKKSRIARLLHHSTVSGVMGWNGEIGESTGGRRVLRMCHESSYRGYKFRMFSS